MLHLLPEEKFVAWADFCVGLDGEAFALLGHFHWFQIHTNFLHGHGQRACCGTCNHNLVAHMQFASLHLKFCHAQFREVANALGGIHLHASGARTVFRGPFAQSLAEVVAVPESTVKHLGEAFVPVGDFLVGVGAVDDGVDCFVVTFHHGANGPQS